MADAGADDGGVDEAGAIDAGPTGSLLVLIDSSGAGKLTSDVPGIDCPSDCYAHYPLGTKVTVTGTPDALSSFVGSFGSGCMGPAPCTIVIDGDTSITAVFASLSRVDAGVDAGASPSTTDAGSSVSNVDAGANATQATLSVAGGCSHAQLGASDGAGMAVLLALVVSRFRGAARRSGRRRY